MSQIVRTKNPLFPLEGREQYFIKAELFGKSLKEVLEACSINLPGYAANTAVFVNDERIDHDQFENIFILEGDSIAIKQLVNGGGGGSNIWSIVAMIALIVIDIYSFGADSEFVAAYGSTMGAIAGAAVLVVGSLLINKFLGPSFPGQSSNATQQLYAITGSSNQARVGQPFPIVFGTYLMAPDVGAQPYVVYEGNNQILYEIFNFGYSNLEFGPLTIGSTPVSDYTNVTTQWSDSNGALTLFPGNVAVSAGATLTNSGGPVTRTTSVNCTSVGIDISATLFQQNSDGSIGSESVVIYPQYKLTTSSTWLDLIQGAQIDPTDGYQNPYTDSGYGRFWQYQDTNVWTLTNDATTPLVQTFTATLPAAGQYDIRLTRLTADIDDTTHYADTTWTQLKSYQPDLTDYKGQTRLAIKIQANNQLNGTISQLQSQVSAKCPVYNSETETWSTTTTSNPAWWFLWFARGLADENGVRILGCGLSDDQIDIPGIIEWGGWCDANSLQFNYILGDPLTSDDVLALIARVGRATKTFSKGVLGVVYDQEGLPVTQQFGMSNIKAGSFIINYISDQLAQQVNVQFINPDLQYAQDVVSAIVPGVTSPEFTSTIFIPGITSKTQAAQEANLQAAAQTLFRRTIVFETDIEGLVCNRGDVISVSHDLTAWSISGRLQSGTTTAVVLDREVTITSETQPYLQVRHPNGVIDVVEVTKTAGTTNSLTLLSALSQNPSTYLAHDGVTQLNPRDAIYSFDPAQTPGRKMKVVAVEPQGNTDNWVKLTCQDEIDAYYEAATNPDWIYNEPTLLNQNAGSVSSIKFSEVTNPQTGAVTLTISWLLNHAAGAKLLLQTGQGAWVDCGTIYGQQYVQTFPKPTSVNVQLTPVALVETLLKWPTVTATYDMIGMVGRPENVSALVPNVTGLQIVGNPSTTTFGGADAKFQWRLGSTSTPEVGQEPQGGDSGISNPYFRTFEVVIQNLDYSARRTDFTVNTNYTYTFEMNSEDGDGVPTRDFIISVTAQGQQNQVSAVTASLTVNNPPPDVPTGITLNGGLTWIDIQFDNPSDLDYAGTLIYGSTDVTLTADTAPLLVDTKLTNQVRLPGLTAGDTYYLFLKPYDLFGKVDLNASSQFTCSTVLIGTIDLGPGSVTSTILANAAVTTAKIVPGAVDSTILATGAVLNANLAAAAVATSNIQSAAITTALIAANAVDTININTGAITTALIASGAVTGANIAANTIAASNIISGTITALQIAANTITASQIAANTITAGQIAANTITASQILAGTITTTQIAANTIVAGNLAAGSVTAAAIAAGTITATQIAASTITASNIAASTITTTQIAANTILGSNIAAATITASNITALTITAGQIAANTITGGKIAANTITASNIAASTITASNLAVLTAGGTSIDMSAGVLKFNNGTNMMVEGTGFGSSSQFLMWYGPTQSSLSTCTTSNAQMYFDTSGNAFFSGTLDVNTVSTNMIQNGAVTSASNLNQSVIYTTTAPGNTTADYDNPDCVLTFSLPFASNVLISASQVIGMNDGTGYVFAQWPSNGILVTTGGDGATGYLKVDGSIYSPTGGILMLNLSAGSHTIKTGAYVDTTGTGSSNGVEMKLGVITLFYSFK